MAQKFLSIKNFEKFQHYNQRNPPWIKLYKSLFGDRDFLQLSISCRYLYIGLLTLASECDNKVVNDPSWIAQRLAIPASEIDLNPLYKRGFLLASASSIRRYHQTEDNSSPNPQKDSPKTETEEKQSPLSPPPGGVLQLGDWREAETMISFLNEKTGKHFLPRHPNGSPTKALSLVRNLLTNGYTLTNIRQVIANRCQKWRDDVKMQEFLRPETLFRPSNFSNYLGELGKGVHHDSMP